MVRQAHHDTQHLPYNNFLLPLTICKTRLKNVYCKVKL